MIEVRCPRNSELDSMVEAMALAFGLPLEPAKEIFYADPYFDIDRKQILVEDGVVKSCYTIVDSPLIFGSAEVPFAGIAGIATPPKFQNRGYARHLLESLPATCSKLGYGFAGLFTDLPQLYEKFGFVATSKQYQIVFAPGKVGPGDASKVRNWIPSDRQAIVQLHIQSVESSSGHRVRDNDRWDYVQNWIQYRIVWDDGSVNGYALYELHATESGSEFLTIVEIAANSDAARRGLVSYMANLPGVEAITYTANLNSIQSSGLLGAGAPPQGEGYCLSTLPGLMVKIVDVEQAIRSMCPNLRGFEGVLDFVVDEQRMRIIGADGHLKVTQAPSNTEVISTVQTDIQTLALVLLGAVSGSAAIEQGKLKVDGAADFIGEYLPEREIFVPAADYF